MLIPVAFLLLAASPPAVLGPVPADTVRVFFVRHGQALSNLNPAADMSPEKLDHLTPVGIEQSQAAGRALAKQAIASLISSPAVRAQETAAEIKTALGLAALRVEPLIRPLDLGTAPDGHALTVDERIAEWKAGRDPSPPGGESMEQVGDRVRLLVLSLRKDGPGRSVVLVAHSEVIGAFLGSVQGKPPAARYPPGLANGSISVVEAGPDGEVRFVFANSVP